MNKIIVILICLFSFGKIYAQQTTVKGTVLTEQNEALPGAAVVFLQQDSLVAGLMADKKGRFSLQIDTGTYLMQVSFLGFNTYEKPVRLLADKQNLEPVILNSKAYELDETVVSADKMQYEVLGDQLVYNVPSRIKKTSANAYQVLTHVPSLLVKLDERSLSVIGSSYSIIMVNNIQRDSRYVSMLRPEDIEKVEVIRNPSIRFASKNIDGIINIVTKKITNMQRGDVGLELNPEMEYGYMDASYLYASDKFNISFYGNDFFFNEDKRDITLFRESRYEGKTTQTHKHVDESQYKMNNLYLTTSMDYVVSPKTFMTLDLQYTGIPERMDRPYTGYVKENDVHLYDLNASEYSNTKSHRYGVSYYWQTQFNEKNMLNLEAKYAGSRKRLSNIYEESGTNGYSGYLNNRLDKNNQNAVDGQLNYSYKFGDHRFESGYRFYWESDDFNGQVNNMPDQMQYKEFRNYVYAGLSGKLHPKWSYRIGVGYDFVNTDISKIVKNDYQEFTPNARLGYAINQSQNISIDFSRNRTSPAFSNLNPNRNYTDTTRVYYGNPYLTPYYTNSLRLNYQLFKSRFFIMGTLGYQNVNDYITRYEFLDNTGVYNITFGNTGRYSNAYFNLNFSVNILEGWKVMANGSVRYNMYEDEEVEQFNKNFWSASFWAMTMLNYKKFSANFSCFPFFRTPTLTGYTKVGTESSIRASYMLNQTISFTAGFRYLIPLKYKSETYTNDYTDVTVDKMTDRSWRFMVGVNISLQKGKSKNRPQKSAKRYNDSRTISIQNY